MKFPRFTARLYEQLVKDALRQSFVKLDPKVQWANPVMFLVWLGALFTFAWAARVFWGFLPNPRGSLLRYPGGSGLRCFLPTSPRLWPKGGRTRRRLP